MFTFHRTMFIIQMKEINRLSFIVKAMTQHSMNLHPGPFAKMKSGAKNIEVLLYDEKRRAIRPGDDILFTNRMDGDQVRVKVSGLCWFVDFAALVAAVGWKQCGWDREYSADRYN